RRIVGDRKAYLTFDIDCLDPSCAPGTGTPVAGGLPTAQAQAILRGLRDIDFVGMDIVEVAPPYDVSQITALAAAHLTLDYLCLGALRRRGSAAITATAAASGRRPAAGAGGWRRRRRRPSLAAGWRADRSASDSRHRRAAGSRPRRPVAPPRPPG